MEKFIKYKRIRKVFYEDELEKYFDELITEGWEIIYYDETNHSYVSSGNVNKMQFTVIIVAGKKQSNVL